MPSPAPTRPPIAAWLVDLDGTLYRPGPLKRRMAIELLLRAPHRIPALSAFRHAHERLRAAPELQRAEETPFAAQLRLAAEARGVPEQRLGQWVADWMVERPCRFLPGLRREGLIGELEAARQQGLELAVVSDYPARKKLLALGLDGLFDTVVANGEPGGPPRLKPDPAGYLLASERLGIEPARCLVIGDRADADGLAASRAGMAFRRIDGD